MKSEKDEIEFGDKVELEPRQVKDGKPSPVIIDSNHITIYY